MVQNSPIKLSKLDWYWYLYFTPKFRWWW